MLLNWLFRGLAVAAAALCCAALLGIDDAPLIPFLWAVFLFGLTFAIGPVREVARLLVRRPLPWLKWVNWIGLSAILIGAGTLIVTRQPAAAAESLPLPHRIAIAFGAGLLFGLLLTNIATRLRIRKPWLGLKLLGLTFVAGVAGLFALFTLMVHKDEQALEETRRRGDHLAETVERYRLRTGKCPDAADEIFSSVKPAPRTLAEFLVRPAPGEPPETCRIVFTTAIVFTAVWCSRDSKPGSKWDCDMD